MMTSHIATEPLETPLWCGISNQMAEKERNNSERLKAHAETLRTKTSRYALPASSISAPWTSRNRWAHASSPVDPVASPKRSHPISHRPSAHSKPLPQGLAQLHVVTLQWRWELQWGLRDCWSGGGHRPFPSLKVHRRGPANKIFSPKTLLCKKILTSNTYALVINDFDNCCQSSAVWSMGEEDHTSNLDEPPLGRFDLDICHSGDPMIDWFSVGEYWWTWILPTLRSGIGGNVDAGW